MVGASLEKVRTLQCASAPGHHPTPRSLLFGLLLAMFTFMVQWNDTFRVVRKLFVPVSKVALCQEAVSPVGVGSCCPKCCHILTWFPASCSGFAESCWTQHRYPEGWPPPGRLHASPLHHTLPTSVCRHSQQVQGTVFPLFPLTLFRPGGLMTLKMTKLQESEELFQLNLKTNRKPGRKGWV